MRVDPNLSSLLNVGIQSTEQALNTAVQQVATGQRVAVPSDDPGATVANLQSLTESANVDRYTKNGDAVLSQAQMADSALSNVVNELNQAITLGTQGADGSMTSENRAAIATQVQSVLSEVVSQANTTFNGVSLFSGTAAAVPAFASDSTSPTGYSYQGNSGVNSCDRRRQSAGKRQCSRRSSVYKSKWERTGFALATDLCLGVWYDDRYRRCCYCGEKRTHQCQSAARALRRRCESDQYSGELSLPGDDFSDFATAVADRRGYE